MEKRKLTELQKAKRTMSLLIDLGLTFSVNIHGNRLNIETYNDDEQFFKNWEFDIGDNK
jgi:hypothetical protein